ncbi:hypothetical protein [uncultured Parabacteroides sp.]|uniref:hypothetical protein n=1 Tax=uncultured Parabacteroides sp. TaxID=512312 RepID=UPI0026EB0A21|nr:hypothetical protein [uncultured Parabacteroides sp.]
MNNDIIYKESFRSLIETFPDDYYIGLGNPNAKILLVGKEGSVKDIPENEVSTVAKWRETIARNTMPLLYEERNPPLPEGHTYSKYQKLHDFIFGMDNKRTPNRVDFFIRASRSALASRNGLQARKDTFFRTRFIQQFPVVVLACGFDYIRNNDKVREIDDIFGVEYHARYSTERTRSPQSFWTHFAKPRCAQKLVINVQQLSGSTATSDELLRLLAGEIRKIISTL